MANGYGSVGSVLTERPPSDGHWGKQGGTGQQAGYRRHDAGTADSSVGAPLLADPPSAPAPPRQAAPAPSTVVPLVSPSASTPPRPKQTGQVAAAAAPVPTGQRTGNRTWYDSLLSGRQYDVVYDDADGYPLLAFAEGQWYDVTSYDPQPVSVRYALRLDPAWAGAVVQTVCMWMRSNPNHDRSFELATELALAVGELARMSG